MSEEESYTVVLKGAYLAAKNQLVEEGVYKDALELIRDALRNTFQYHDIEPFVPTPPKLPVDKQ